MISNELILSLMFGTLGFVWGVTRWQPFIITKDRDDPFLSNWSFPIRYIKPVFNFYYEHYGIIGSLYLKCIGYSLSIKGKVTDIKLLELIVLFIVFMIPNWLFKHTIPHDKKHQITYKEVFGMHPRARWSGGKGIL